MIENTNVFLMSIQYTKPNIDGLVQERCNSIAKALELHLSVTKPLMYT